MRTMMSMMTTMMTMMTTMMTMMALTVRECPPLTVPSRGTASIGDRQGTGQRV
jgi:hypothetical protein